MILIRIYCLMIYKVRIGGIKGVAGRGMGLGRLIGGRAVRRIGVGAVFRLGFRILGLNIEISTFVDECLYFLCIIINQHHLINRPTNIKLRKQSLTFTPPQKHTLNITSIKITISIILRMNKNKSSTRHNIIILL